MRSWLFVPGDSECKLDKAPSSGADVMILDLEDSVAPGRKATAREMARVFLDRRDLGGQGPRIVVRVNPLATGLTDDDLAAVVGGKPDGIMLPKPKDGRDVEHLAVLLAVREAEAGIAEGATEIHALAGESAPGVLNAASFANRTPRLSTLSWGGEDLAADIGALANRNAEGEYTEVFRLARSLTLLAAANAGVAAIDTVFTDFRDGAGLEQECRMALRDGFVGKLAIHPGQVPVINAVFTPSQEEIDRARRIVALFAEAGPDAGVLSLDGRMLDRPHLRQAERLLARAQASGEA